MTAAALLADLRNAGFVVWLDGSGFRIKPAERTTPELRERIKLARDGLLKILRQEADPWPPDPPADMPAAVLVIRPDGSQVYVPLRDYQAGPDTLNPPEERKSCPPKPSTRTATRRRR